MIKFNFEASEPAAKPDWLLKKDFQKEIRKNLKLFASIGPEERSSNIKSWLHESRNLPIFLFAPIRNYKINDFDPHLMASFLGPYFHSGSALWDEGADTISVAEKKMFDSIIRLSQIENGMKVLNLFSGLGGFDIYLAERFPSCQILTISHSRDHRNFIQQQIGERKIKNLQVRVEKLNDFNTDKKFDRIIALELFEVIKNYEMMISRISQWLVNDGLLMIQSVVHLLDGHSLTDIDRDDWLSRQFLSGVFFPSETSFFYFQKDLELIKSEYLSGQNYAKSYSFWHENLKRQKKSFLAGFKGSDDKKAAKQLFERWKRFLLLMSELFSFNEGKEWFIGRYIYRKNK